MSVGAKDILITLQQATESKSTTTGQLTVSWSDWNTAFAEVISKSFTEGEKTNQVTNIDERIFRIRYMPGVTTKMRIYDAETERYYSIIGISPEGRKKELLLTAKSLNINAPA